MNKQSASAKKSFSYPAETNGSKWAAENRKKANGLNDAERAELFKGGILRLYGGIARQAVRTGR